jgi:hypothetical protein
VLANLEGDEYGKLETPLLVITRIKKTTVMTDLIQASFFNLSNNPAAQRQHGKNELSGNMERIVHPEIENKKNWVADGSSLEKASSLARLLDHKTIYGAANPFRYSLRPDRLCEALTA